MWRALASIRGELPELRIASISHANYQPLLFHSTCLSFITSFGPHRIRTNMSFGFSVGDFIAATQLATDVYASLRALDNKANQDSVIILSFRSLQAQRIKELQQELYQISLDRVHILNGPGPAASVDDDALRVTNEHLDRLLNNYGWSGALPARLTTINKPQLRQYAITRHFLKRQSTQTH